MTRSDSKATPSPFRLFLRFAVAGLVGFIVIAFLLFQVWMRGFERYLINETKGNTAKYVNALVSHQLRAEDFHRVKKGEDWEIFREKIADLFSLAEIIRVKIYNPEGELIWSDARQLLELSPSPEKNPELLKSLEGHVEANISRLHKEEHRFERGTFKSLMELYVPIYAEQGKKPVGVAEVYLNVDPLYATLRTTGWLVGLTVVGGLGLLLAISYIGLGRAVLLIQRQNQNLRAALEEIFKANRLKEELVASLSQEIRNPDAIMGYGGLLLDGAFGHLPDRQKPSLEKVRNTAAELLSHFPRIVELARLKVGDVQPQKEPVELTGLLRDITSDLLFLCGNGAVALNVEVPPYEVIAHSDRSLLQEVVLNLVTNAIKFTSKGHIQVRLEKDKDQGKVKIVVEDTGIGMKPEELRMIFDEFYRGSDPHARFKSGVGLGLAIVKRSLDLLQGEIQVESIYGKGSKFTVTLPREL